MTLPPQLFSKYLTRFDELITEGEEIDNLSSEIDSSNPYFSSLLEWKVKCISLLDQVIPLKSTQRSLIEELKTPLELRKTDDIYRAVLRKGLSYLRGIKSDFENGFLENLTLAIEAEIAADYMGQAEQLLAEGKIDKYDYVPAAVLSGAVLEKALRTFCKEQNPPVKTINSKGEPLTLTPLIEGLKKVDFFKETTAKQLKAWAGIRNDAAHGNFENFSRTDVEAMIQGIKIFLARYMA